MGEDDTEALSAEDTMVLSAEDMNQILEEVPEDGKSKEEEDGSR
jgi:hypothetical protein